MNFGDKYGPWAIIAGASEGTGRAFTHKIASQGVNCILISRRKEPLNTLAEELTSKHNIECATASVDLSSTDAIEQIAAAVGTREVGLFISNAGADTTNSRFLDADIEEWIKQINRNVMTLVRCCHLYGGQMRERGRGGIILVGSGACYGGASYMATYSATKAFDLCFGESLWSELQPHGVDVLNLILGQTDTPALRASLAKKGAAVPEGLASADEVAEIGLAQLAHGPVHNWGQQDDEVGYAPNSPAVRRARTIAISEAVMGMFGKR